MSAILALPVPIEVMAMGRAPGRGRLLTARWFRRPGTSRQAAGTMPGGRPS